MASFLYCSFYSFRSSNYCDSNSCRSFTILKAIAKSKNTHVAIAFKSEKEQCFYLYSSLSLLIARKSDNYCCRNSWKSDRDTETITAPLIGVDGGYVLYLLCVLARHQRISICIQLAKILLLPPKYEIIFVTLSKW